jgi:hypothetical protein
VAHDVLIKTTFCFACQLTNNNNKIEGNWDVSIFPSTRHLPMTCHVLIFMLRWNFVVGNSPFITFIIQQARSIQFIHFSFITLLYLCVDSWIFGYISSIWRRRWCLTKTSSSSFSFHFINTTLLCSQKEIYIFHPFFLTQQTTKKSNALCVFVCLWF